MKLKEKFLLLSRGKQIALVVCLLHLFAILGSFTHHIATSRLKAPRTILVKTTIEKKGETRRAALPMSASPQPKRESQKRKEVAAATKPKKETAKPKAAAKPSRLLKEIEKSSHSLEREVKAKPELKVPSRAEPKIEAAVERIEEPTYSEFLIAFLQNGLDLPEYGEVRVKMEIDRFGKLIDCEILEAKSKKNGEFLKERLPDLSFPSLADFGIRESTHTFTITFRNI